VGRALTDARRRNEIYRHVAKCAWCDKGFVTGGTARKTCSAECKRKYQNAKVNAWNAANREKKRAANLKYRAAHPDKVAAATKNWQQKNRDKVAAWRAEHKEQLQKYAREYSAKRRKNAPDRPQ